jgi:hypothetical protein
MVVAVVVEREWWGEERRVRGVRRRVRGVRRKVEKERAKRRREQRTKAKSEAVSVRFRGGVRKGNKVEAVIYCGGEGSGERT